MKNVIEEYHWGSHYDIARLIGSSVPSLKPQAELWMGAHPKAPSMIEHDGKWISLFELINEKPLEILGPEIDNMPFLFKVLAAEKPLSLQVHPDIDFAQKGFLKENSAGILINAYNRNYRDSNHKPECVCAITDFWALKGFQPIDEIVKRFSILCPISLENEISVLRNNQTDEGLKIFFHDLITSQGIRKKAILTEALENCRKYVSNSDACSWVLNLYEYYPDDITILSPLFLNVVFLRPGEAMYVLPGELHSYLKGMAVELTANSDNVLRGGLTSKHKDIPELLEVLRCESTKTRMIRPQKISQCESIYINNGDAFALSKISVSQDKSYVNKSHRGIEIILCTEGTAELHDWGNNKINVITSGMSVMIPASVKRYTISGSAILYKAGSVIK